ncbi:hypothetical protein KFU94_48735 [Chloroflexi bacterium TSY]|nr:hypothetical protein [Chloroflexi bacterium TSY]
MVSVQSHHRRADETKSVELGPLWHEVREYLVNQKKQILQDIRDYPPPIPACDEQYNYLLEKRTTITREINQLTRLCEDGFEETKGLALLREFVSSSLFIDEKTARRFALE